jgi:hypothetical protein
MLVEEYVARDSRGEFRTVNQWYNENTRFDQLVPGWDEAAVIVDAVPSSPATRGDTVLVPVRYSRVGFIGGDGQGGALVRFQDTVVVAEFKLLDLGSDGLRIVEPVQPPHFSIEYVLQSPISDDQRIRLKQALERRAP